MRVVIPYVNDKRDGHELRYCIRSMAKHFKDISGVLLIGDRPAWYTGDYIHNNPRLAHKEQRIISNVMQAPDESFLLTSDDTYALSDFDATLPHYHSTPCTHHHSSDRRYRAMYRLCPAGWLNFDIHHPMVVQRDMFHLACASAMTPVKTTYANNDIRPRVKTTDCKIKGKKTEAEIRAFLAGRPFFSTHDNAHYPDMLAILNELYPDPSPYEC